MTRHMVKSGNTALLLHTTVSCHSVIRLQHQGIHTASNPNLVNRSWPACFQEALLLSKRICHAVPVQPRIGASVSMGTDTSTFSNLTPLCLFQVQE